MERFLLVLDEIDCTVCAVRLVLARPGIRLLCGAVLLSVALLAL